jgi:hypothetical protein
MTTFNEMEQLQTGLVTATEWNELCWQGSLANSATQVLKACDQAVAQAKNDLELWMHRDSRGLTRALTGNLPGAIEDFEFVIEKTDDETYRKQRRAWVQTLRFKKNPFSQEVLQSLRDE